MERALGGQVGFGPAQPGEVQDPGEVGAGGGGSHPLSWSWPFHILALPNLALPFEI